VPGSFNNDQSPYKILLNQRNFLLSVLEGVGTQSREGDLPTVVRSGTVALAAPDETGTNLSREQGSLRKTSIHGNAVSNDCPTGTLGKDIGDKERRPAVSTMSREQGPAPPAFRRGQNSTLRAQHTSVPDVSAGHTETFPNATAHSTTSIMKPTMPLNETRTPPVSHPTRASMKRRRVSPDYEPASASDSDLSDAVGLWARQHALIMADLEELRQRFGEEKALKVYAEILPSLCLGDVPISAGELQNETPFAP
jgi:hypothetical protein